MVLDFVSLETLFINTCILFNRSGKPAYFSAVFNTHSPAIKQSWISNLQMAKLALGTLHWLFLNRLLGMTVSMFNMTYIIKAAYESERFTARNLECFTFQSMNQSVMTQSCYLCLFFRWEQSAGLVLCWGWRESDQKAETSSLTSTDACGHVKTTRIQGQTVVLPQCLPVLVLMSRLVSSVEVWYLKKAKVRSSTTVPAVSFITLKAGIVESLSDHSSLFRSVGPMINKCNVWIHTLLWWLWALLDPLESCFIYIFTSGAPSVQIQSLHSCYCHPPFVLTC